MSYLNKFLKLFEETDTVFLIVGFTDGPYTGNVTLKGRSTFRLNWYNKKEFVFTIGDVTDYYQGKVWVSLASEEALWN